MKKTLFTLLTLLFVTYNYAQETSPAFEMNARLGRGINMGNAFEAPTETAWSNPWRPEYFGIMSELGFSHVRIPIRWEPAARSMATPPYTITPSFLNRIKEVVDNALANKLHAIINMHHHEALFDHPDEQKERFLSQWEQIAEFFKDYPDSLLFEPLNEPNGALTPAKWNAFFAEALQRIRLTNPERMVVMGTANWGGLGGLPDLVLPKDPNLILTIHYYNPFTFTHQGAEWVNNSTPWLGTKWTDTEAERETIRKEFAYALQFSETHNIPIHIGEFGAYSKADAESRSKWTTFVSRWFEEQSFSWAYWEFSAGFGIYNPNTKQLNTSLVNALLHNPIPDPIPIIATPIYQSNFQSGNDGWNLQTQGGASGSLSRQNGKLQATLNSPGTESWHIQLIKPNLSLKSGSMYRVNFVASAAAQRSATVYVGRASSPWDGYSGYLGITLTPQETDYTLTFTMPSNDTFARLVFDLGTSDVNITLTQLAVEEITIPTSIPDTKGDMIRFYPNPVKDIMYIEHAEHVRKIMISDMLGRHVFSQQVEKNMHEINLSVIPKGMYVVTMLGSQYQNSFTILKQ